MVTGHIFDIQRFSIHDGPGVRTTVFFQGCPLRCLWCGNPESIPREPLLSYMPERCIACGECLDACPHHALFTDPNGKVVVDRQRCTGCGACPPRCAPQALEIALRVMNAREVIDIVARDQAYYETSGGGMTLSGGEPLLQPEFAEALLREARGHGWHCAVETSGYAMWGAMRTLIPHVDLWLYDFKETDRLRHEQYVGKPNELILDNLKRLHDAGAQVVLRCPMIPEHNARQEHLDGIVKLALSLPRVQGVELLPYYDLWRAKLQRFGLVSQLPDSVKPPDARRVNRWKEYLRARGVTVLG